MSACSRARSNALPWTKPAPCARPRQLIEGQAARVDAKAVQSLTDLDALSESFPKVANCPFGIRAYWRFEEEPLAPTDDGLATQINAISDSSGNSSRLDFWPGGRSGVGRDRSSSDVPPPGMFRPGYDGGQRSFDCGALPSDGRVAICAAITAPWRRSAAVPPWKAFSRRTTISRTPSR